MNIINMKLKDELIDDLNKYSKKYLIIAFIKFLNSNQLEDLKDSIDREIF